MRSNKSYRLEDRGRLLARPRSRTGLGPIDRSDSPSSKSRQRLTRTFAVFSRLNVVDGDRSGVFVPGFRTNDGVAHAAKSAEATPSVR